MSGHSPGPARSASIADEIHHASLHHGTDQALLVEDDDGTDTDEVVVALAAVLGVVEDAVLRGVGTVPPVEASMVPPETKRFAMAGVV